MANLDESKRGSELPVAVGLCADPWHTNEWFIPLKSEQSETCPLCNLKLVVYVRKHKAREC